MASEQSGSSGSLGLAWPKSVHYHDADNTGPESQGRVSPSAKTEIKTYNGMEIDVLRDARELRDDEIRLLTLHKGIPGSILEGSLRKVRLSDGVEYQPVSYTWANYDDEDNGIFKCLYLSDRDCLMEIKDNCAMALSRLRDPTTDRTIWVDAICVNQEDPDERSRQVKLMHRIYARAFTVLVYLGEESEENCSNMAMDLLSKVSQQGTTTLDDRQKWSISHLFKRPYFQRMWIIQEVALAQTLELYCGSRRVHISAFANRSLEPIMDLVVPHAPWLGHSKIRFAKQQSSQDEDQAKRLLILILDTVSCKCADDRDRIFALLSLLNSNLQDDLVADYNLCTRQVYAGIAAYLITKGLVASVLELATQQVSSNYLLPTWAPDWARIDCASQIWIRCQVTEAERLRPRSFLDYNGMDRQKTRTIQQRWRSPTRQVPEPNAIPSPRFFSAGLMAIQGVLLGRVNLLGAFEWPLGSKRFRNEPRFWCLSNASKSSEWRHQGRGVGPRCDFVFPTACVRPIHRQHLLFLLPNHDTLLILGCGGAIDDGADDNLGNEFDYQGGDGVVNSSPDEYSLVQSGQPYIHVSDGEILHIKHRLSLSSFFASESICYQVILSLRAASEETNVAVDAAELLCDETGSSAHILLADTDIEDVLLLLRHFESLHSLWQKWQLYASRGFRILNSKGLLQLTIDELAATGRLEGTTWKQLVEDSSQSHFHLGSGSLCGDLLSLFILHDRDERLGKQTPKQDVPEYRHTLGQPMHTVLKHLTHWAKITFDLFEKLRAESDMTRANSIFPMPSRFRTTWDILEDAKYTIFRHVGVERASFQARHEGDQDETTFLINSMLKKIMDQRFGAGNPVQLEPEIQSRSTNEKYWDWEKFTQGMEERMSAIAKILPLLRTFKESSRSIDLDHFAQKVFTRELLAEHGVDLDSLKPTEVYVK